MQNTGIDVQSIGSRDFIAGWVTGLPQEVVKKDGDWRDFYPTFEKQYNPGKYDTMSCVTFAAMNTLETMFKFKYGLEVNFSDRFTAKMSGTSRRGNWFVNVWNSIRHHGFVSEELYPFGGDTWDEYMQEIPQEIKNEAKQEAEKYDIGYEWIVDREANGRYVGDDLLRWGLKRGPLQVSIGDDATWTQKHSLILGHLDDDGTRHFYDHYGRGVAVNPPTRRIYAALRPFIILNEEKPSMPDAPNIPNRCLVRAVLGNGMATGFHLNGKIIVPRTDRALEDKVEIMLTWHAQNPGEVGPSVTLSKEDWDLFQKTDLSGNPIS